MSRLDPPAREDLTEHEGLFQLVETMLGFLPNSMLMMARNKAVMEAFAGLAAAVWAPGKVSGELKALVAFVASRSAGCQYCMAHTAHSALHGRGVAPEKFDAVWDYETSPLFTAADRAALVVAQGAGQVPNQVTDEDFNELREHFGDDEIVEIVAVVSLFGWLNRWNDTFSTPLEQTPIAFAKEHLTDHSWTGKGHL
ncbi:carboxymuconolactone decarboxylase family protein [bacterium AH-315-P15]|nr:carboxymuconolactone decarboxylase family protein [bacterium AH-315-P15]